MAKITIKRIEDKKEWESFLEKRPEANFLQSWYWGEFYEALGNHIERTGFYKDGLIVGAMLSIIENAKRARYLIVPGGPIIDWKDSDIVDASVSEVKRIAKTLSCVFVRVRPQLIADTFSRSLFRQYRFRDAPMHLHAELTSQLDIGKSEEDLLKGMRKTTRHEIKKAINLGVKITASKDPSMIRDFYDLQVETSKRQKFVPFSYDFLYKQFEVFASNNSALLYSAFYKDKLLAQAFIVFYGREAVYHYGASTQEGRLYPGAYLIQWNAIKEAKKRGTVRYNFWGVAPLDKSDHRFSGLSMFKRGFGGGDFEYIHAQDLIIDKPKYLLSYIVEFIRKKLRRV